MGGVGGKETGGEGVKWRNIFYSIVVNGWIEHYSFAFPAASRPCLSPLPL